jgi:hypothetical protein
VAAFREAIEALLAANRAVDAARLVVERRPAPEDESTAVLSARALLRAGLCDEALALLPARLASCDARHVRSEAAATCGRAEARPTCTPWRGPLDEVVRIFDFEHGLPGWQLSAELPRVRRQRRYVSGYSGSGLLRTDGAGAGRGSPWTGLSPEFDLPATGLSLEVGGGTFEDGVSVALIVDGQELCRAAGQRDAHLRRATCDVTAARGHKARLRVVDRGDGEWGYILLDHVRAHPLHYFDAAAEPP